MNKIIEIIKYIFWTQDEYDIKCGDCGIYHPNESCGELLKQHLMNCFNLKNILLLKQIENLIPDILSIINNYEATLNGEYNCGLSDLDEKYRSELLDIYNKIQLTEKLPSTISNPFTY